MKLLFQSSNGSERVIAEVNSFAEANEEMDKFMEERNFQSYYKRLWQHGDRVYVDCGSHCEFFVIEPCTMEFIHNESFKDGGYND